MSEFFVCRVLAFQALLQYSTVLLQSAVCYFHVLRQMFTMLALFFFAFALDMHWPLPQGQAYDDGMKDGEGCKRCACNGANAVFQTGGVVFIGHWRALPLESSSDHVVTPACTDASVEVTIQLLQVPKLQVKYKQVTSKGQASYKQVTSKLLYSANPL